MGLPYQCESDSELRAVAFKRNNQFKDERRDEVDRSDYDGSQIRYYEIEHEISRRITGALSQGVLRREENGN